MKVKLEDVCERGSSSIKQSDIIESTGDYPIFGAAGYIGNVDFYQQEKPYVAVVKDGAGIGRTTLHPAKSSVIGTMQYLIPKENVLPEYLYYVVRYMHLEKYFTGATIPHIYFKDYKNEQFNLDPVDVQKRIVNILGKCEKIISDRQSELAKLDDLIRARFVEMFGNFVYERDRWSTCKIGDISDTIDPQPSHRTPSVSLDGIPYIGIAECNYKTLQIDFANARKVGQDVLQEHLNRYTLDKGDFIIGKIGTIGKPFFLPVKQTYTLSANTVLIKPNKLRVEPQFLFAVFQSEYMERIIDAEKKSTSQPAFGIQKVRKIDIPMPPLELQQQFAAFVEQADKSKLLEERQVRFIAKISQKPGRQISFCRFDRSDYN